MLLQRRDPDVDAGARDAAGAGVVRHRRRSSATSRRPASSRRCSATSSSGRARLLRVLRHAATSSGASRRCSDQGLAGAVMMIEGSLVTIIALAWLFLRLAPEGELRQRAARARARSAGRPARRALRARAGAGQRRLKSVAPMRSSRRPPRRPGRLLDRAEPAVLPRSARRRSATTGSARSRASAARRSTTSWGAGERRSACARRRRERQPTTATRSACTTSPSRRLARAPSTSAPSGSSRRARDRERAAGVRLLLGYYAVFFYDPDGIKLEIVHVPPPGPAAA